MAKTKFLAEFYGNRIRKNPNWRLKDMQEEIKIKLKLDVTLVKCMRVRNLALASIHAVMKEHYSRVWDFGAEIMRSNKMNTVKTTMLNPEDEVRFKRFYICYNSLKKAWREGCRPILGFDGCFLKTVCGGQLLSAVGRDGNNQMFPVAMAVVETENGDS